MSLRRLFVLLLFAAACGRAMAHTGPPFPILENSPLGPALVTVWANPDVGGGPFFIVLDPRNGVAPPLNLSVRIGVQPVSGRLTEAVYNAWREDARGQTEYKVVLPFDREERWHIHLMLTGTDGHLWQQTTDVDVTPPGYGRWDLLLFSLPFLGIALLWFKAMKTRRTRAPRPGLQQRDPST